MNAYLTPSPREILVIREGSHRITWERIDAALWQPTAVWPTPEEAERVRAHLERGGRVLVLLDPELQAPDGAVRVPVLREELATAPERVKALAESDHPAGPDPLVDITIRLLDWLPAHLQAAGLAAIRRLTTPSSVVPRQLSGVTVDDTHAQVRYARLPRPRTPSDHELDTLARLAFPVTTADAANTALGLRDLTRAGGRIDLIGSQRVYAA
jgi:hypothetical protein